MAAVLGLEDQLLKRLCADRGIVVAANIIARTIGDLGEKKSHCCCCEALKKLDTSPYPSLWCHSPLMEPAKTKLAAAIENTSIVSPICPIYQNVPASGVTDAETIKSNLIAQLTAPVKWTQSVQQLLEDGATEFTEVGPGKVLQGLVKKIDRSAETNSGAIV